MKIAGIDYSISSPAICVHSGKKWSFENCSFYFFYKRKKEPLLPKKPKFQYDLYPEYKTQEDRYIKLGKWTLDKVHDCDAIFIEGYAFAGKGLVFQIGENTGTMKTLLYAAYNRHITESIPPKTIKKFATDNGNASKQLMQEAFIEETQFDLKLSLEETAKQTSPSSDIIDAYFICKYGFNSLSSNR